MATSYQTTNIGLGKWASTDILQTADVNNNMDIIDSAMGTILGTDWNTITSFLNGFTSYNGDPVTYKSSGKMIYLRGELRPEEGAGINTLDGLVAFSLPEAYRPVHTVYAVCNGIGVYRWLCRIMPNGNVLISHYGALGLASSINAETHLPFSITYMI